MSTQKSKWNLVHDGESLAMLQHPDGRVFRLQQLGKGGMWDNADDNDEVCAELASAVKDWKAGWRHVSATNLQRASIWHPDGLSSWSVSDWAVAAAGEMGEACDAVKKMNRARDGIPGKHASVEEVGDEIADTILYLDLLAQRLDLDISELVQRKFNLVSEREGFAVRLEDHS